MRFAWSGGGTRQADVVRRLLWGAAFVVVLPLQSSVVNVVAISGVAPDLPLIGLLFFSIIEGPPAGFMGGAALGLALDLFSASGTAFYTGVYASLGLGAALIGRLTANVRAPLLLAAVASASVMLGGAHAIWFQPFERAEDLGRWLTSSLGPQALYDTVFAGVLYAFGMWWHPAARQSLKDHDDFFSAGRFPGSV